MILGLSNAMFTGRQRLKPWLYVCVLCFVFFKAIVPVGFMLNDNSGDGFMVLCHGDSVNSAFFSPVLSQPEHSSVETQTTNSSLKGVSNALVPDGHSASLVLCSFSFLSTLVLLLATSLLGLGCLRFIFRASACFFLTSAFLYFLRPASRAPPFSLVV